ncbi:hypothetical protein BDQ17DRAFT_1260949, partial [Cyathus striatus]
ATNYGTGLWKFHIFCDIFSVAEEAHLPAAFPLLHSFALWATVSVSTTRKYLAAIHAWHLVQGWPLPLMEGDHEHLEFSLWGMARLQGTAWKHPPHPPVTLEMLRCLQLELSQYNSFNVCVWAMVTATFFGLMWFGEVAVPTCATYRPDHYLSRSACIVTQDADGCPYARLRLPHAKTAAPGKVQDVFLVVQEGLCPLLALHHLAFNVPAGPLAPLFSWHDRMGIVHPMLKVVALGCINDILTAASWGTSFGHSFRIGSASFYLAKGVSPEIIWLHGHWHSLVYEVYIRAFECIASRHLADQTRVG